MVEEPAQRDPLADAEEARVDEAERRAHVEECARRGPALDQGQAAVEVPPHDRLLLRVAAVARHHRIEAAREVALPVERIEDGGLHGPGHEDHPARAARDRIAGLDEGGAWRRGGAERAPHGEPFQRNAPTKSTLAARARSTSRW